MAISGWRSRSAGSSIIPAFYWAPLHAAVPGLSCTRGHDVPNPPGRAAPATLPRYSSAGPASYNLEINAGEARRLGLSEGAPVRFVEIEAESAKC